MYDTTLNDRLTNFCIYISNSLPFMTENGIIIIEQWNALNSRKTAHLCRVQRHFSTRLWLTNFNLYFQNIFLELRMKLIHKIASFQS